MRYAYFPDIRRLAIDYSGKTEVYDTTGFEFHGFGQQQSSGSASLTFTSQRGAVRLDSLPRASVRKATQEVRAPQASPSPSPSPSTSSNGDSSSILSLIEQLGTLKEKGILTEQEFAAKKAELLKRL